MQQNVCGEIRTSVLGFGCGSVLGRVGRSASLRAMNCAWDLGITLFDTARSYGFGEAETVLGDFLRGKREQAIVTTKYGIHPRKQSALNRMILPAARVASQIPGVRGLKRRGSAPKVAFGHFTVEGLRNALETSLRELRTDRVDVLFLHEATASALHQHDLITELDALVQAGKVLRVGLYAGPDVIADGMANGPATLTALQFGADFFDPLVAEFTQHNLRRLFMIANHPFGSKDRVARIKTVLAEMSVDQSVPVELREKIRGADWSLVLEAILGMVLNAVGAHVLVFSMMRPEHQRLNANAIERNRFTSHELQLMYRRCLHSSSQAPCE
ncbi:MAG: aldo/keto reductase [Terracidiphilus sp.]|jgi:hypothetical protein